MLTNFILTNTHFVLFENNWWSDNWYNCHIDSININIAGRYVIVQVAQRRWCRTIRLTHIPPVLISSFVIRPNAYVAYTRYLMTLLLKFHRLKWFLGRARFNLIAFLRSLLCIVTPPSARTLLPISDTSETPEYNFWLAYDTPQCLVHTCPASSIPGARVSRPWSASWRLFPVGETIRACALSGGQWRLKREGGTRFREQRPDFPDGRELTGLAEGSYPYRYTTMGRAHVPHRRSCRATLRIRSARRAKGARRLVGRGGERAATSRGESRSLGRKVTVIRTRACRTWERSA